MMEISDGKLRMVRWTNSGDISKARQAGSLRVEEFEPSGITRCVLAETDLCALKDRIPRTPSVSVNSGS